MSRRRVAMSMILCALFSSIVVCAGDDRTGTVRLFGEQRAVRVPIIVDTDLGSDIDDAFALALALASPELDVRGITTVGGDTKLRAMMVCRWLTAIEREEVPVAIGPAPQPPREIGGQAQYGGHPNVLFNRSKKPEKEAAVEFLYARLRAAPGELTLVCLGPLTNIARLLSEHPDCKTWIKRIVLMGGSIRTGYEGKPPAEAEFNIQTDVNAAQTVFSSGIPLLVVPLDATASLKLTEPLRTQLFSGGTALTYQVQALHQLSGDVTPTLYDPPTVALAFNEQFLKLEDLRLDVDDKGFTRVVAGKPNARVATGIRGDDFLNWYVRRVAAAKVGPVIAPLKPANVSTLIPPSNMPRRVHVFEDYETDIEKRWWMSGVLETANVPPGSRRACRGVLTQDFDDKMGQRKAMYTAVIFNPVPGPPMGPNSRLSFRYWLKGTSTLRVQIYSLTNGYHRHLTLTDLPQGKWQEGTVDMTQVRRPDGSGGALAEDERIDDIQFYTVPQAELLIDDIVLYEAAPAGERRPFPARILFTGWFDTGKLGQEWPGDFEIVPHQPPGKWKAARSVVDPRTERPWIRVGLRGSRALAQVTRLRLRYRLTGGDRCEVELTQGERLAGRAEFTSGKEGAWSDAAVDFRLPLSNVQEPPSADQIRFRIPQGAQLLIDDLLLYEPGSKTP